MCYGPLGVKDIFVWVSTFHSLKLLAVARGLNIQINHDSCVEWKAAA
jgi:hypothetical protein